MHCPASNGSMRCDECIALEKQVDEALAAYHEAVNAMRTGVTREHVSTPMRLISGQKNQINISWNT